MSLLASSAFGCYAHHELDGIDSGIDSGMCGGEPTFVEGLRCPEEVFAVGEVARVEFRHRVGVCCESGTSTIGVGSIGPGTWSVSASWVACECHELLDCLGPGDESIVEVGPLVEGVNIVRAGAFECAIEAEAASECGAVEAGFIAPRVLFDDQRFATSLGHEAPGDCGCSPEVTSRGRTIDLRLCGCGDACDAALTSYSGSWIGDTHDEGNFTYQIGGGVHELHVVPLEPPVDPRRGLPRHRTDGAHVRAIVGLPRRTTFGVGGADRRAEPVLQPRTPARRANGCRAMDARSTSSSFHVCSKTAFAARRHRPRSPRR